MSISQTVSDLTGKSPVSRGGKTAGRGAFNMQSAQAISAAYYFDLAGQDYVLADREYCGVLLAEQTHRAVRSNPT